MLFKEMEINGPRARAQPPTLPTRRAHMAHGTMPAGAINSPRSDQRGSYCIFVLGYMGLVLWNVCSMEGMPNSESHGGPLNPLDAVCSLDCANSSCKTQTGRRCRIFACLEIVPGVHFSNSPFCGASASTGATAEFAAGNPALSGLNLHSSDNYSTSNCIAGHIASPSGFIASPSGLIASPSGYIASSTGYTASQSGWPNPGILLTTPQTLPSPLGGPRERHPLSAMPRLRQHMRCRRGTSRGLAMENPPSPLSELSSSSEDDAHTPPPASRGGGARGRGRGRRAVNYAHTGRGRGRVRARNSGDFPDQPPLASEPPGPPGTLAPTSQPPPDFPTSPGQPTPRECHIRGATIRQTTQNAELRFHCTFFDSIITALISVSLREEIPPCATPSLPFDHRPSPPPPTELRSGADNKDLQTDSHAGKEDSSEENEYACRVEEEPMSSEHEG